MSAALWALVIVATAVSTVCAVALFPAATRQGRRLGTDHGERLGTWLARALRGDR